MNFTKTELKESTCLDRSESMEFRRELDVDIEDINNELFGSTNSTPLGRLLAMIGALPEIRQDKVFNVREQLNKQDYDLGDNLDTALDKVLEELLSES